jgi:dCTP diphosphatase
MRAIRIWNLVRTRRDPMDFNALQERLGQFADARGWDPFHSPKNLVMALSVEAAELLEHFQWLSEHESTTISEESRAAIAAEVADIQIYLAIIAGKLGIDIDQAVDDKIATNALKYPAGKVGFRK